MGDFLRRINAKLKNPNLDAALKEGELFESVLLFPILKAEIENLRNAPGGKKIKAVLLDGFPRSLKQLQEFVEEV